MKHLLKHHFAVKTLAAAALVCSTGLAQADLKLANAFSGNVGLSVDGVGGNNAAVGQVQAIIPVGATILKAFLYSAGSPSPFYADAPKNLADYNATGITLAGNLVNNFDTIVGATSDRVDIGRWFTGRADVTALVRTLTAGAATDSFSWAVTEGALNNRIDGEVLAIVYSHPSLALATVALLDGGQRTGGETTTVNFVNPLTDPSVAGFAAQFGIASSFSVSGQASQIAVNGTNLTRFAGNNDDGAVGSDGSLITVGGIGDDPANNVASYADDDELYTLKGFLKTGDTSMSIRTSNATNDDNIFFAHLYVTANIKDINGDPIDPPKVPEPQTAGLVLLALAGARWATRKRGQQTHA
jgi:hypothetical protein